MGDGDRSARLTQLRAAISEREARLAEAFLRTGNRIESAKEAGFTGNPSSLSRAAQRALKRPPVQAYIDALRAETFGEPSTLLERARDRLALIAFGEDIEQPVGRGGTLKMRPAAAAVQVKALETLIRMLGGLDPRVRRDLAPEIRAQLEAVRRRVTDGAYRELLLALSDLAGEARGQQETQ